MDINPISGKVKFSTSSAKFTNANYAVVNRRTTAQNQDLNFSNTSNSKLKNQNIDLKVDDSFENKEVNLKNDKRKYSYPTINSPNIYDKKFLNNAPVKVSTNDIDNTALNLLPEDMEKVKNSGLIKDFENLSLEDAKTIEKILNTPVEIENSQEDFVYEDIDWDKWKIRLINKITYDSGYIKELDGYPVDTPIYYSFDVDNNSNVKNIVIISLVVEEEGKQKLAKLLKSYEHKQILKFPKDSKRKKANISAIMLLSDQLEYANSTNFKDVERIKKIK